jgi:hypothetical protein
MATGTVILPVNSAQLDDTNPPGVEYINGAKTLLFDDTTPQVIYFDFRLPENYASAPVLKWQYGMDTATSGLVDLECQAMAVTPGDALDMTTESYDTANSQNDTVPGTAEYLDEISNALTNFDSAVAGDYVRLKISRDADDGTNDTATGDMRFWGAALEYTTS